jgi:8-oxo-dGTP pyrophosphatase MutT (NUDIX family)
MNEPALDPERVPIRPAATVVVVRDAVADSDVAPGGRGPDAAAGTGAESGIEVLLVCRNRELAFHGGSWVFPGGRVDDAELADAGGDEAVAARRAAVREVAEETGLVIVEDDLVPFSHWTTPVGRNRRFSTSFFLAPAPAIASGNSEVAIDLGEIHDFGWFSPEQAVALSDAGDTQLAGPTYVSLLRLLGCPSVAAAVALVGEQPYQVFRPRLHRGDDGLPVSVYEEDVAYESGDLGAAGPRHRMIARGLSYEYVPPGAAS